MAEGSANHSRPVRRRPRSGALRKHLLTRVLVMTSGFLVLAVVATSPQAETWVDGRLAETRTVNIVDTCDAVNVTQPHGVGRPGARDIVVQGQRRVTDYNPNRRIYRQHVALDADRDGIACERH
jgi:hypothetical protein